MNPLNIINILFYRYVFFCNLAKALIMIKNLQLIGVIIVVLGSFLPLVHIPLIGNWTYWKIDPYLASMIWVISALGILFIQINKPKVIRIISVILMILFIFTIIAVKFKSLDYFSFLPFRSWRSAFAGIVKLSWGWFFEFAGALLMLLPRKGNQTEIKN